jgi:hypothetical protein
MSKIRIPRKLKKHKYGIDYPYKFPYIPKLDRYLSYLDIKWSMKYYKMTPEQLCETFGRYNIDMVIWYYWVIWKNLGIVPQLQGRYKEYWNEFVDEGIIKLRLE